MKTKQLTVLFLAICGLSMAQTNAYLYVHGKNRAGTKDSVLNISTLANIDSITFSVNSPAPVLLGSSTFIAGAGSTIILTGTNFPALAYCKVYFGSVLGTINSATATTISVTVPKIAFLNAKTTIQVENSASNSLSNGLSFIAWTPDNYFTDNFDRASTNWDNTGIFPSLIGDHWATGQGGHQINSNFLNSTNNGQIVYRNPVAAIYPGRKFILEANLKVNNASDPASFAGIAFNIQNDGQTYQLIRINAGGVVQALTTFDNGTNWIVNFSDTYALPGLQFYHFQIIADGSNTYQLLIFKMDRTLVVNTRYTSSLAVTGYKVGLYSLGGSSMYDNFSLLLENTTADYIPLFGDNTYERGFNVRSTSSTNPNIIGKLDYAGTALANPNWEYCQWSCVNNDMTTSTYSNVGGIKKYKKGTEGNEINVNSNGTLTLVLNSSTEFGLSTTNPHNPRQAADPWPNSLIQNSSSNVQMLKISSSTEIRMNIDYTVTKMNNLTPSYNPGLHTAQFVWYITIQNRNTTSPDFGKYIWFGLNFHDFRYQYSSLNASPDIGPNNTGSFIYSPAMQTIMQSQGPAQVGKEFIVDVNVLPMIKNAFNTAQANHYLPNTTWNDLYIGGMNVGIETPGTFDVAVDINFLNIKYH